jgi:hypothetical protein
LRLARLQLASSNAVLQDHELKAERFLGLQYRRIASGYEQIRAQRSQREALAQQLKAREEEVRAGRRSLDVLLEAQRFWAGTLANEYNAVVAYNNALCAFAYARGAIMEHAHVTIFAEPVPEGAAERAADREWQRTWARVAHEPARRPFPTEPCSTSEAAPSVPALWKGIPPLAKASPLSGPQKVQQASVCEERHLIGHEVHDLFPKAPPRKHITPGDS